MILAASLLSPETLLKAGGPIAIAVVASIIFAESGLFVGFFLPGDSLLFIAGFFARQPQYHMNIWLLVVAVVVCAILGDTVGYWFGRKAGPALFSRPESRLFKPQHLQKAHTFYERHGKGTIIIARFIPIVRTFAPIVAGAGEMEYRTFLAYNVIGAVGWGALITTLGYALGTVILNAVGQQNVDKYLYLISFVIVLLSVTPMLIEVARHRRAAKAAALAAAAAGPEAQTADRVTR